MAKKQQQEQEIKTKEPNKELKSLRSEVKERFVKVSELGDDHKGKVIVEGTFVELVPSRFTKEDGSIEYNFKFEDDEGAVILNRCASLDWMFKKIPVGTFCQVVYLGKEKYNGKATHQFDILYA